MSDAFISYRRKPSASLALLFQEKLNNQYKIDCYVDTTRTDSTQVQFPERLMRAIENAPVFICLLGDTTLESEWVLKEIRKAYELNKFCIPIFQESYKPPENPEDAVLYLLNHDGIHVFDIKSIYINSAVSQISKLILPVIPDIEPTQQIPNQDNQIDSNNDIDETIDLTNQGDSLVARATIMAAIIGGIFVVIAALISLFGQFIGNSPQFTPPTQVINNVTEEPSLDATLSPTATIISTAIPNPTQIEMTIGAEMLQIATEEQSTRDAINTLEAESIVQAEQGTLQALTATADASTAIPTFDVRSTAEARSTINAQSTLDAQSTQVIIDVTATAYAPIQLAIDGVSSNNQWTPYSQQFDSIFMMLVPAGCLRVGNDDGGEFEQPSHIRCLENPYWIDQNEVSNGQFTQFDGVAEEESYWNLATRPRENITWYEAKDFCALREARLPTELEWEYAARGVDNLLYSWGNGYILNRAVHSNNFATQTADVLSFYIGISWIESYHMLGNVSEWTSSQSFPYPYNYLDGRENMDGDGNRIARGGSYNSGRSQLSTTIRFTYDPDASVRTIGFRCVRDFSIDDIQATN